MKRKSENEYITLDIQIMNRCFMSKRKKKMNSTDKCYERNIPHDI